jgi:hypothetical protein
MIVSGRPLEHVLHQYLTLVKPAFEDFFLPTKKYADVIIPRGADNYVAIDLVSFFFSKSHKIQKHDNYYAKIDDRFSVTQPIKIYIYTHFNNRNTTNDFHASQQYQFRQPQQYQQKYFTTHDPQNESETSFRLFNTFKRFCAPQVRARWTLPTHPREAPQVTPHLPTALAICRRGKYPGHISQ